MHSELFKRKLDILDPLTQIEFALRQLCIIVGIYFEKFYTSVKISVVELGYISILSSLTILGHALSISQAFSHCTLN